MKKLSCLLIGLIILFGQSTYEVQAEKVTSLNFLHTSVVEGEKTKQAGLLLALGSENLSGQNQEANSVQTPSSEGDFWGWMSGEVVLLIFLVLGVIAFILELVSKKYKLWGLLSIIAFGLFFLGTSLAGYVSFWSVFLFLVGLFLLLVELFIPGFGIPGLLGLGGIVLGLVTSKPSTDMAMGSFLLAGLLILATAVIILRKEANSPRLRQIILKLSSTKNRGYSSNPASKVKVGDIGIALTKLRPSGFISINGEKMDAISDDGFIEKANPVEVIEVQGSKILVRRK